MKCEGLKEKRSTRMSEPGRIDDIVENGAPDVVGLTPDSPEVSLVKAFFSHRQAEALRRYVGRPGASAFTFHHRALGAGLPGRSGPTCH